MIANDTGERGHPKASPRASCAPGANRRLMRSVDLLRTDDFLFGSCPRISPLKGTIIEPAQVLTCLAASFVILAHLATLPACKSGGEGLVFCCQPGNDLYAALAAGGRTCPRFDTPAQAIARADAGGAVLLLADGYPDARLEVGPAALAAAAKKHLKIYIEYPSSLEGLEIGPPRDGGLGKSGRRGGWDGRRAAPDAPARRSRVPVSSRPGSLAASRSRPGGRL